MWLKRFKVVNIVYQWFEKSAEDGVITIDEILNLVEQVAHVAGLSGKLQITFKGGEKDAL